MGREGCRRKADASMKRGSRSSGALLIASGESHVGQLSLFKGVKTAQCPPLVMGMWENSVGTAETVKMARYLT